MRHPASAKEAHLSEVFSSLQGEGPYVGEKQIFIRFEECHIHCEYCDELDKPAKAYTISQVMEIVDELESQKGPHRSVSLTGGEPLLYLPFIEGLIPKLKARGLAIYLETDGILWKALESIIDLVDVVAMDMKPPSVTKEGNFDEAHRKFLEVALKKDVFVKVVLSHDIVQDEFDAHVKIVQSLAPQIPFILQPISAVDSKSGAVIDGHDDAVLMERLEQLKRNAQQLLSDVRIVPRLHKILKIR